MAVAFGSVGTLVNSAGGNPAIPYPASIAAGDLLILQYACAHASTPTTPAGWSVVLGPVAQAGASPAQDSFVYSKIASGSESGTLTVSNSGTGNRAGIMSRYTGAHATTPIDVSATANLPTSGTTATAPSVTTTVANTRLLHMYWDYSTSTTITPNASDTERYDTFNAGLSLVWEMADKAQAATGATGTSVATAASAMAGGLAATIAIAPLAGAAPVANFTGTPTSGVATLAVTFTDSSTNTPTSWSWTFGDTGTSSSQNPSHNYTAAGTYTVVLVATNATGSDTKTRTAYITVTDPIVYATGGGITIY